MGVTYEEARKEERERARCVLELVNEILQAGKEDSGEIGCGIGEVLVNLPRRYAVYGLDVERDRLRFGEGECPGASFLFPMHNFRIDEDLTLYSPLTMLSTF